MAEDANRKAKIRAALKEIEDEHGRLDKYLVLAAAKDKKHPLHSEFEWSDKAAAEKYRLERAQDLITFVTVVTYSRTQKITSVSYVRDPTLPNNKAGMISITSDALDRNASLQIIHSELDRCAGSITRARGVAEVLNERHPGLVDRLEAALAEIIDLRGGLEAAE